MRALPIIAGQPPERRRIVAHQVQRILPFMGLYHSKRDASGFRSYCDHRLSSVAIQIWIHSLADETLDVYVDTA